MPLILPGNVGSATASTSFNVANSVRFDTNAYMHKTPSGAGSLTTWTFSTWIKRAKLGSSQYIFTSRNDGNNSTWGYFNSDDTILFFDIDSNADQGKLITNRKFRDVGAWYNLTFIWNTTSGTAGDRIQLWVNGVRETSFSTQTNPDQNDASTMGDAHIIEIARGGEDENYGYFYMAETVYQNNSAASPVDVFGEFDSDSGIWKPKDVSGLTFGTNGFYLDFEASGNLGNDANGGTDLTEVNVAATDQSIDTCTNNFCTMNPLANFVTAATFSEGNLVTSFANGRGACTSTFGLTTGKWYVEMNITTMPADERFGLGISPFETKAEDLPHEANNQGLDISGYNAVIYANLDDGSQVIDNFFGNNTTRFDSFTGIIGMALDLTSSTKTIAFSKAGAWVTGGGTSDTNFANALKVDISTAFARHSVWHVANGTGNGDGTNGIFSMNFGSPAFAISSGNTDGDGFGNFEYAVPSGYFSLCTKNLAEYG